MNVLGSLQLHLHACRGSGTLLGLESVNMQDGQAVALA